MPGTLARARDHSGSCAPRAYVHDSTWSRTLQAPRSAKSELDAALRALTSTCANRRNRFEQKALRGPRRCGPRLFLFVAQRKQRNQIAASAQERCGCNAIAQPVGRRPPLCQRPDRTSLRRSTAALAAAYAGHCLPLICAMD